MKPYLKERRDDKESRSELLDTVVYEHLGDQTCGCLTKVVTIGSHLENA